MSQKKPILPKKRKATPFVAPPPPFSGLYDDLLNDDDFDGFFSEDAVRCECGSDKVYGPTNTAHSFWCAKYEKNP